MGLLALGTGLLVSGCALISGESTYRFRMTVEVQTPQGLKSGSSVMEVSAAKQVLMTSETHPISAGLKGEAVVVDLPGGPIFALLTIRGDSGPLLFNVVTGALNPLPTKTPSTEDYMRQTNELAAMSEGARTAELPRDNWPMMIRFRDLNDPMSVERVDPAVIGVKRITLAVTKEPVTVGIVDRTLGLNFFGEWGKIHQSEMKKAGGVMANPYFSSLSGHLSRNDFVRRGNK